MTKKQVEVEENTVSKEDFDKLQAELDGMKDLASQFENQLKRAVADYQNLEKRVEEGRTQLNDWATTDLIQRILPSLDHLETVVDLGREILAEKPEIKDWYRGVELAVNQLAATLKDTGLGEIAADGQFDPSSHEAVDTQEGEENKIIKVAQKGYTLNGKVLRPAKVVVGRKEL